MRDLAFREFEEVYEIQVTNQTSQRNTVRGVGSANHPHKEVGVLPRELSDGMSQREVIAAVELDVSLHAERRPLVVPHIRPRDAPKDEGSHPPLVHLSSKSFRHVLAQDHGLPV